MRPFDANRKVSEDLLELDGCGANLARGAAPEVHLRALPDRSRFDDPDQDGPDSSDLIDRLDPETREPYGVAGNDRIRERNGDGGRRRRGWRRFGRWRRSPGTPFPRHATGIREGTYRFGFRCGTPRPSRPIE
jgi:hypothetical protein